MSTRAGGLAGDGEPGLSPAAVPFEQHHVSTPIDSHRARTAADGIDLILLSGERRVIWEVVVARPSPAKGRTACAAASLRVAGGARLLFDRRTLPPADRRWRP